MVTVEVITPWVEQVVRKVFGIEQLENGADTGIIVESLHAPASIKVGVGPGDIPNVWVTAALLKGVEPSPALFELLNRLNRRTSYLRFYFDDGRIFADTDLVAETLRPEDLGIFFMQVDSYVCDGNLARILELPDAVPVKPVQPDSPGCSHEASASGTAGSHEDTQGAVDLSEHADTSIGDRPTEEGTRRSSKADDDDAMRLGYL